MKVWTPGELLSATDLNDNFDEILPLGSTVTTFTPSLSAATTPPTLGTGATADGKYQRIGDLVWVSYRFVFGSSMNPGSGAYRLVLPINASAATANVGLGVFRLLDSGTTITMAAASVDSGGTFAILSANGSLNAVAHNVPWTWAQNDAIGGSFIYQAA